uniref:Uncharacterized protein n=1 Tax=Aegilops tauschii subsp. strangulata TaxID=200361 RepID=A0A453CJJ1_AEGTS
STHHVGSIDPPPTPHCPSAVDGRALPSYDHRAGTVLIGAHQLSSISPRIRTV